MKTYYLAMIIFLCGAVNIVFGQTAYYDAIKLKSYLVTNGNGTQFDGSKEDEVNAILSNPQYIGNTAHQTTKSAYKDNVFIYPYLPNSWTSASHELTLAGGNGATAESFAGNLGGLNVTNIANGIADFLIDRAKQELTIAFFDRFKKFAADPDHPEFVTLFPQTTSRLDSLLSYNYPQMLPQLRSAFLADLKQAPYHLEALLELPKYKKLLAKFPEIIIAIKSLQVVHDLEDGTSNAADVIKAFATDTSIPWNNYSNTFKNIGSFVKLASILSESLRDTNDNPDMNIWVSSKQIKALASDNALTTLYMGLIYQQIKTQGLQFYSANGQASIAASFALQKDNILLFQNKISEFISLASKVSATLASNRSKENLTDDDVDQYISVSIDAINYAFGIANIFDSKFNTAEILAIPLKANSLYKDIYTKQYTQAIADGLDIFTNVSNLILKDDPGSVTVSDAIMQTARNEEDDVKKILKGKRVSNSAIQKIEDDSQITDATITNVTEYARLKNFSAFIQKVKPYAIFMANIIEAKNSDDVKSAVQNAVLPVGSYTIKQNSYFNASLNGYIGYAFDINYAKGIYAPIGISVSGDIKHFIFNNLPITAFFSVVDLGSVVSYQLSNPTASGTTSNNGTTTNSNTVNTSSLNPQIKLGSLFSPSAEILFEWHGFPLAFGGGWRRTPTLYYSTGSAYSTVGARNVWIATVLIDIPFITFHNNPRTK